jgi:hypothetical protein
MKCVRYERLFVQMKSLRDLGLPYDLGHGIPFDQYFNGTTVFVDNECTKHGQKTRAQLAELNHARQAAGQPPMPPQIPHGPSVNCVTGTEASLYREWELVHAKHFASPADAASRIDKWLHYYWMINNDARQHPEYIQGCAYALDRHAGVVVQDGGLSYLANPRNLRRGDAAQIWWRGVDHLVKVQVKNLDGSPALDANGNPKTKLQRDYEGHSVFIHDVMVKKGGEVWFQVLSAQAQNDTKGVGVAGSKLAKYDVTQSVQAELFAEGRWMRYLTGWQQGQDVPNLYTDIPEIYVARLQRPFPVWPVALKDDHADWLPLPEATVDAAEGTVDRYAKATRAHEYFLNNESGSDGFFPIGTSRAWHGGIHLHAPGARVRAISDGVIVAARCAAKDDDLAAQQLARDGAEASESLPSRAFVLIRHQIMFGKTEKAFYSLYMHLDAALPNATDKLMEARWLWQARQPAPHKLAGYSAQVGKLLAQGDVVLFAHPVAAGEVIGFVCGDYVHVEVFASEDITDESYPTRKVIEAGDDPSLFSDSPKVLAKLEDASRVVSWLAIDSAYRGNEMVGADEIADHFQSRCELDRQAMRGVVTHHVSEWSTAIDWSEIGQQKAWAYYSEASVKKLAEIAQLYAWMSPEIASKCKLPANHQLWHYHPVVFIEWLSEQVAIGNVTAMVQDVVTFLANAGEDFDAHGADKPATRWRIDETFQNSAGHAITELALFPGTADAPNTRPPRGRALASSAGPWEQIGDPVTTTSGTFVLVELEPAPRWICVSSGADTYAREDDS